MKNVIALVCSSLLVGCVESPEELDPELEQTEQPTICGTVDDSQFVNDYNGALGPTTAFVQTHKRTKGALETTATASSSAKFCSGSLIGTDLFLTAGHCVDSTTVGQYVAMNYERAAGSTTVLTQSHYRINAILEDAVGGVDYAIIRLDGSPGSTWGVAAVAAGDPTTGTAITIIGHPNRQPKMIEAGTVSSFSGNYLYYGNIDTLGGSSGSGVINNSGQIIGVHTNGGCTTSGGANSGIRISQIRAVSSIL